MVYMYSLQINGNPSGCYMSNLPRTLRTPLNSPYTPYTPYTPIELTELNTSNNSGFPISLKKLILTRCNAWRGKQLEQIRTVQGVIRVKHSEYSE